MDAQDDIVWIRSSRLRYATLEDDIMDARDDIMDARDNIMDDQNDDWYG